MKIRECRRSNEGVILLKITKTCFIVEGNEGVCKAGNLNEREMRGKEETAHFPVMTKNNNRLFLDNVSI